MSIIEEKINKNTGILKVSVKIKDYKDKVAESIKGYRKKSLSLDLDLEWFQFPL